MADFFSYKNLDLGIKLSCAEDSHVGECVTTQMYSLHMWSGGRGGGGGGEGKCGGGVEEGV